MKYTETVKKIDKTIKLYKHGLLSIQESFDRISCHISEHINSLNNDDINITADISDRLYRNALNKLNTVLKCRIKYN